ncbi:dephospho-CoA kinase [Flavobacterium sp. RHBU_3]|uniref:dephospho-CoA kinase n=1 Tax=Flavobacterium sp. RHBU_3 TaxID=3391184 RepID=UPI003984A7BE
MKTKVIGLTGGIGSGKTTVAKMFETLGVPVYYADDEAKKILYLPEVVEELITVFGAEILQNGQPDRARIAALVFNDKEKLAALNGIIHPKVGEHFSNWAAQHATHPFVIKEAAILFESGSYKLCDAVILVTAPIEERISRVMQRDGTTRDQVLQRMANQWTDEQKKPLSQFIIESSALEATQMQVSEIFNFLNIIEK